MPTKLERLLEKEAQLKAQIQQAKAAERTLEKKRDTRRKILIGAAVMARVERGEWPEADLRLMMNGFLTRASDREMFDLDGSTDSAAAGGSVSDGLKYSASQKKKVVEKSVAKAKRLPEPSTASVDDDFDL